MKHATAVYEAPATRAAAIEIEPYWRPSRFLVPIGRALFSLIFLLSVPGHFSQATIGYALQSGVPMPEIAVPLSGIIAGLGGLSILLGLKARWGAWLIVLFLVPVTVMMHNFWTISDPAMRGMQQAMFMKNLALIGGALLIAYFGAGPYSIDRMRLRWKLRQTDEARTAERVTA
jgi:putative oxidoreductase